MPLKRMTLLPIYVRPDSVTAHRGTRGFALTLWLCALTKKTLISISKLYTGVRQSRAHAVYGQK